MTRLDKQLAHATGLSRKQATAAIKRGRVTVDGDVVRNPAVRTGGRIALDGEDLAPRPVIAVFHKPIEVQCTVGDPMGRMHLGDVAPEVLAMGLHPVGRLDADTSGLLLFSADGALTQRLLHPKHGVEKTYRAVVEGTPGAHTCAALLSGVETALGTFAAVRATLVDTSEVELTVTEGKHRMVRRMLHNIGHSVVALRRIRFGAVALGDLDAGAWRPATDSEVSGLR